MGLPGDTIKIQYGDIWIHRDGMPEGEFPIARKPPQKLLAMLQPVFDNDCMPDIARFGWPQRWTADADAASWKPGPGGGFVNDGRGAGEQWLHYQHRTPTGEDWGRLKDTPEWQRCCGPEAAPTNADWKALERAGGRLRRAWSRT